MWELDHLAVSAADLDEGTAWVEAALGVRLVPGGQHARYGTHNRLLGLGPGLYFEVIAPDPDAPKPPHPRWFALDQAAQPRLGNWIVRTTDLGSDPADTGTPLGERISLTRGDLAWDIAVPPDGSLPLDGGLPTLIRWTAGAHPSTRLPDTGIRLTRLEIHHPEAGIISTELDQKLRDPRVTVHAATIPALRAAFATPSGERWLG